jgi:YD repeat-containing protein
MKHAGLWGAIGTIITASTCTLRAGAVDDPACRKDVPMVHSMTDTSWSVPFPYAPLDPADPGQIAQCFLGYYSHSCEFTTPYWFLYRSGLDDWPDAVGMRPNMLFNRAPAPELMPVGNTIEASNVPLIPPNSTAVASSRRGFDRATAGSTIDIVTGLPLMNRTDLELPFDGAVFRLTRSRSGQPEFTRESCGDQSQAIWDWAGTGWVSGEAPILLIDATLPDVVGYGPARCWFVLDAHTSIPFSMVVNNDGTVSYEAPPRFRAKLTTDAPSALWDSATGDWQSTRPTKYYVDLFEGAVRYTIDPVWTDVPRKQFLDDELAGPQVNSEHHPPRLPEEMPEGYEYANPYQSPYSPGGGIPYYGLTSAISDRYGHSVHIEYAPFTSTYMPDIDEDTHCLGCYQSCNRKGMIRRVQLKSGSAVRWTLLYAYREFFGEPPFTLMQSATLTETQPELWSRLPSISSIYVYPGDQDWTGSLVFNANDLGQPVVESSTFAGTWVLGNQTLSSVLDQQDGYDPLSKLSLSSSSPLYDWQYRIQYCYGVRQPTLHKVVQFIRQAPSQAEVATAQNTVYWYQSSQTYNGSESVAFDAPTAVFSQRSIDAILDITTADVSVNKIATKSTTVIPVCYPEYQDVEHELPPAWTCNSDIPLEEFADMTFKWGTSFNRWGGPSPSDLKTEGYLQFGNRLGVACSGDESVVEFSVATDRWEASNRYRMFSSSVMQVNGVYHISYDAGVAPTMPVKKHFRLSRAFVMPSAFGGTFDSDITVDFSGLGLGYPGPQRGVYFAPYAFHAFEGDPALGAWLSGAPDLQDPRWLAVIDEFDTREHAESPSYESTTLSPGMLGRRVVKLNALGFVLSERSWDVSATGDPSVSGANGYEESFVYGPVNESETDPIKRQADAVLKEHRTLGWSVADLNNLSPSSNGLVEYFEYDGSLPAEQRMNIAVSGIQKGWDASSQPTRYPLHQEFRHSAHPEEVEFAIDFLHPVAKLSTPPSVSAVLTPPSTDDVDYVVTYHIPHFKDDKVIGRTTILPPRRMRPGSSGWYFPVEKELYDAEGKVVWRGRGMLADPTSPGSGDLDSFAFDYTKYDSLGRELFTVQDIGAGLTVTIDSVGYTVPSDPSSDSFYSGASPAISTWARYAGVPNLTLPALQYVTTYKYDGHGKSDVFYPNGRQWAKRYYRVDVDPDPVDEEIQNYEVTFNDLVHQGGSSSNPLEAMSPGIIRQTYGGPTYESSSGFIKADVSHPGWTARVNFTGTIDLASATLPSYTELSRISLASNPAGSSISIAEAGSSSPELKSDSFDFGEIVRKKTSDGAIIRTTRTFRGLPLRTYKGTTDKDWGLDADEIPAASVDFNMILTDRAAYGEGVNDIYLPIASWTYKNQPSWASDPNCHSSSNAPDDSDGTASQTRYDWRMRPVRIDQYAEGSYGLSGAANRLQTELVFLDHQSRERLRVTYGPGGADSLATGLDPSLASPGASIPERRDFLTVTNRPISMVEQIYDPSGSAVETRVYNVGWQPATGDTTSQPDYLASRQFKNGWGQEVFAVSSEGTARVTFVDAAGRAVSSATVRPSSSGTNFSYELSRQDSTFDADGNVIEQHTFERVRDAGSGNDVLTAGSNAVCSYVFNYYDVSNRLIAVVEAGSGPGSDYSNASSTPTRYSDDYRPTLTGSTISTGSYSGSEKITIYEYDTEGNRVATANPNGSISRAEFDKLGRLTHSVENADPTSGTNKSETYQNYKNGRVSQIWAPRSHSSAGAPSQLCYYETEYGADVVDGDFNICSRNATLVGKHMRPLRLESASAWDNAFTYRYFPSGLLAERIDARGVSMRYRYDALDRLTDVDVGTYFDFGGGFFFWFNVYPDAMYPPTGEPADRLGQVHYEYDASGRLALATARDTSYQVVHESKFAYDARGNLLSEAQSFATEATSTTPKIEYTWDYVATGAAAYQTGYNRLVSMLYPEQPNFNASIASGFRRNVQLEYGTSGSTTDAASWIAKIKSNSDTVGVTLELASFTHTGQGRRLGISLGAGLAQQAFAVSSSAAVSGMDKFGRVTNLEFVNNATPTAAALYKGEYGFDAADNRLFSKIKQVNVGSASADNKRSQLYTYDALNRLVGTEYGELVGSPGSYTVQTNTLFTKRTDQWGLDALGNWSGEQVQGSSTSGRESTGNLDGWGTSWALPGADSSSDTLTTRHAVNAESQITSFHKTADGSSSTTGFVYDMSGNLVLDDGYFYQYDAWQRLIQINQKGTLTSSSFLSDGSIDLSSTDEAGPMVRNLAYDAIGRLVRTQRPITDTEGQLRIERYYYDGVRRIQEVYSDPIVGIGGDPEFLGEDVQLMQQILLERGVDPEGSSALLDLMQLETDPEEEPHSPVFLDREYVWGPGGSAPLDELIAQFDRAHDVVYAIHDIGGDLVSVINRNSSGKGRVCAQYTYDPYGAVLTADHPVQHAYLRIGHKGLFYDGWNEPLTNSILLEERQVLRPNNADGVYHVRNRAFNPALGIWMQEDPNSSGEVLLDDIAFHGSRFLPYVPNPDLRARLAQSLSLFEYVGGNPPARIDPFGLAEYTLGGVIKAGGWGAAIGGTSNAVVTGVYKGGSTKDIAVSFGKGALAGAVGGAIGYGFGAAAAWAEWEGFGVMVGGSFFGGAGSGATSGLLNGRSGKEVLEDAGWGAALGLFSGLAGTGQLAKLDSLRRSGDPWAAEMIAMLDELGGEFLDVYFSAATAGFSSMADEVRH